MEKFLMRQDFLKDLSETCICPVCNGKLNISKGAIICLNCDRVYPVTSGIPNFTPHDDPSDKVQELSDIYDRASVKHGGSAKSCGYSGDTGYLSRLNILRRWFDFDKIDKTKILDIGCGTGLMTADLAAKNEVWGIDISLGLLGTAMRKGLKTVRAPAETLPFMTDHFDMAICIGVIPYYKDPSKIFSELCRVTRPGGRIVVSSTADSLLIRVVRFIKNISGGFSQLAHLYTTAEIEKFLTLRGAKILDSCTGYKENVFSVIDKPPPLRYRLLSRTNAVLAETAE